MLESLRFTIVAGASMLLTTAPAKADPPPVKIRVDLGDLACINSDDEIGILEDDEVMLITASKSSDRSMKTKTTRSWDDVEEGENLLRGKRHIHLAEAALENGESLDVAVAVFERDRGASKSLETSVKEILARGILAGPEAMTEPLLSDLERRILGRGGDDLLGTFVVRVSNRNGVIHQELVAGKRTRVGGTKRAYPAISKGGSLRMRMRHRADANEVDYLASARVVILDDENASPTPIPWHEVGEKKARGRL